MILTMVAQNLKSLKQKRISIAQSATLIEKISLIGRMYNYSVHIISKTPYASRA